MAFKHSCNLRGPFFRHLIVRKGRVWAKGGAKNSFLSPAISSGAVARNCDRMGLKWGDQGERSSGFSELRKSLCPVLDAFLFINGNRITHFFLRFICVRISSSVRSAINLEDLLSCLTARRGEPKSERRPGRLCICVLLQPSVVVESALTAVVCVLRFFFFVF